MEHDEIGLLIALQSLLPFCPESAVGARRGYVRSDSREIVQYQLVGGLSSPISDCDEIDPHADRGSQPWRVSDALGREFLMFCFDRTATMQQDFSKGLCLIGMPLCPLGGIRILNLVGEEEGEPSKTCNRTDVHVSRT